MTQDPGVHGTGDYPAGGTPPGTPSYGAPSYGSPAPDYGTPPPAPAYGAPQQPPAYGAPQQPPAYGAPQQPPVYGAPQQPPAYGAPQQPVGGYGQPAPGGAPLNPAEEKQYSMFAHLGGILGFIPALIIYLIFKDRGPFIKDQSTEALNFQLTALIGYVVLSILAAFIIIPLNLILWLVVIVFSIIGGMAANRGEAYRYPFSLRLIK